MWRKLIGLNCDMKWDGYQLNVTSRLSLIERIEVSIKEIPIEGVKDEIFYFTLSSLANNYYLVENSLNYKIFQMIQTKLQYILVINLKEYRMIEF